MTECVTCAAHFKLASPVQVRCVVQQLQPEIVEPQANLKFVDAVTLQHCFLHG